MRAITSRRATSGVVVGMFILLILFLAIVTIYSYHIAQDHFNGVVNARHQQDWEIINEEISIPSVNVLNDKTLVASLNNLGAVPARLVTLWLSAYNGSNAPQWQRQYKIDVWLSPGETKYNFGQSEYTYTRIHPGLPGETVDAIMLLNIEDDWWYSMKLVTERGNVAIYTPIPDTPPESKGGEEGGYPIVIVAAPDNFQYQCLEHSDHVWSDAWIKPSCINSKEHPYYRWLLNNTTRKDIELDGGSLMIQGAGDAAYKIRYIVSPLTDIANQYPTQFISQTIPAGTTAYVYFAAEDPYLFVGNTDWVKDYQQPYLQISLLMYFRYAGETELRLLGLPAQGQQLT